MFFVVSGSDSCDQTLEQICNPGTAALFDLPGLGKTLLSEHRWLTPSLQDTSIRLQPRQCIAERGAGQYSHRAEE